MKSRLSSLARSISASSRGGRHSVSTGNGHEWLRDTMVSMQLINSLLLFVPLKAVALRLYRFNCVEAHGTESTNEKLCEDNLSVL